MGTLTSQVFVGGLLVNNSTINDSCPLTYEASSLEAPSTNSPSFNTTLTFCSRSITIADLTLSFAISFKIVEVSTFVNSLPVVEICPKMLTVINAAIIQKSGPRNILFANCGDGLLGFLPLFKPLSLGTLKFFFCAT